MDLSLDKKYIMDGRKLFISLAHHKGCMALIIEIIRGDDYDLASYENMEELGSQSMRKEAETFLCSGRTVSPTIIAIFLRAGWTISETK